MKVRQASLAVILATVFIDMAGIGIVFPVLPKLIEGWKTEYEEWFEDAVDLTEYQSRRGETPRNDSVKTLAALLEKFCDQRTKFGVLRMKARHSVRIEPVGA